MQPVWFAYQDGTGAWTAVTGSNHVYQFNVTQSKGGFAYVWVTSGGQTQTFIDLYAQSQLTSGPFAFCPAVGTNSMHGTVAGLDSLQEASVTLAQGSSLTAYPETNYALNSMLSGSFDLVAWETGVFGASAGDKVIIRRNVAVQNGGAIPVLDFNSAEANSAATGTITVTNAGSGTLVAEMAYYTGSSCTGHGLLYFLSPPTSSFTAYGVPASLQNASDFHGLTVGVTNGNNYDVMEDIFHTMGNRTETFAPSLPQPTMFVLSGSYKRLQAVFTMPADYNSLVSMVYHDDGSAHSIEIGEAARYIGGTSVTLAMPDFSTVSGFNATWEPASGATTNWIVQASGGNLTGRTTPCLEDGRLVGGKITGTN
ncbi:MAG: hypothetical protein ACREN3_12385 [Gemmatimonadaceae bacterium]